MKFKAKIISSLLLTFILSSCGFVFPKTQRGIPPTQHLLYGESISIYSDEDGNDCLGEVSIDLDDIGICFTYNLVKPFEFLFDATYLKYKNASFYKNDDNECIVSGYYIYMGNPNFGYLKDKEGFYFNCYLGIKYKDEFTSNLQKKFSFDKGINVFHIPLSNDEWYIDKKELELVFKWKSSWGNAFLSNTTYLSPEFAEKMYYSWVGFVFSYSSSKE